ncbi:MAG: photosystem I reaction center subunit IX [Methylacidiphilales bacterium]|nr:photosystem I reaction center subunit IX [Candidatus Methylacidiphilales bacterium]NJR18164.1 photosystem I reaction center subunit IX [Calothrix sp. CSU_2_0]
MQQNDFLRYLSIAPVLLFALLIFTAGLLIEFNRFFPDLLFHPLP